MRQALARMGAMLEGRGAGSERQAPALEKPEAYPWERVTNEQVRWLRQTLPKHYAPATVNKMLAALRGVLDTARRMGLAQGPAMHGPCPSGNLRDSETRHLARRPGKTAPTKHPLTWRDFEALLSHCAEYPRPAGRRDAALIAVVAGTGLQRQRVVELKLADYETGAAVLHARANRGQPLIFHLSLSVKQAIESWLEVRGWSAGALLQPIDKSGRCRGRAMTDQSAYEILHRRARQAGLEQTTSRALHYGPDTEPLQRPKQTRGGTGRAAATEWVMREVPYFMPAPIT